MFWVVLIMLVGFAVNLLFLVGAYSVIINQIKELKELNKHGEE